MSLTKPLASQITYNSGGGISAVDLQAAISELDNEKVGGAELAGADGAAGVGWVQSGTGAVSTTVQGKLREFVSVTDFGAVGDGVADDATAIQSACDTGMPVTFPKGTYNFGTYASPSNLLLQYDNQTLYLNGSELRFVGKGQIDVNADDVTLDLQGGILTQYVGYAEVATETISGTNQIAVVDASRLFVGQNVTSSWGNTTGSSVYPLGGPLSATPKKIISISGNTVTLDSDMTAGDVLVPQVIFGDFTFGAFLQCFKNNFVVRNGIIDRVSGYYYHSPNGVVGIPVIPGGHIYFQNVQFNGNGTDQFLIKHDQKLHLDNCQAVQQWDTAKSGIYFADSGSLYATNCEMHLGNFDASFTLASIWDSEFTGGEIVLSNSSFYGNTRFTSPPTNSQGSNCLHVIELVYNGTFDRISTSNCRFAGYNRQFISSTVDTRTISTVLTSLRIDNCLIDGGFSYFLHSGIDNGFICSSAQVSNTSFFHQTPYEFHSVAAISGALSKFVPSFDNCYFKFSNFAEGYAKFYSPAMVSDSTFDMNGIAYQHSQGTVELDNCIFTNNPSIQISPTYADEFYGEVSGVIVDSPDFPSNPNAVFSALGGASLSGAKIATARSINGSILYDVYKIGTSIQVSGNFTKANGVYKLRSDDYYTPIGSNVRDMYLGTIEQVSFSYLSGLTTTAITGATSIVVGDATGVMAGDLVNIVLDNNLVDTRVVAPSFGGTGLTIPLTSGLSNTASSGSKVNFFRLVDVNKTQRIAISEGVAQELYSTSTTIFSGSSVAKTDVYGSDGGVSVVAYQDWRSAGNHSPNSRDMTLYVGLADASAQSASDRLFVMSNGSIRPSTNGTASLGAAGNRWSEVFAANGIINTSDAREKTEVQPLTEAEISAAKDLSKEIGTFKFLSAVYDKGDNARKHIGMTVQRAIEIMASHNLDPMSYGFICYDEWGEFIHRAAVAAKDAIVDEDGNVIQAAVVAQDAIIQPAGDRYGFRTDQLLFFITRGFEARISALE